MFLRFVATLCVLSNLLAGCTFYPGFGPLPNPDLYYVNLSDVVGGVKCAMHEFFYEREYIQGGDANSFVDKRFELDHTKQASIELILNASTTGSINYAKIDLASAGVSPSTSIITVGNSTTGLPFPSLTGTAKGTNTVDITLAMPQTVEAAGQVLRDKNNKIIKNKRGQYESALAPNFPELNNKMADYAAFEKRCKSPNENGAVIDYLDLKRWLMHLLSTEEASIWNGAPEVYLDQLVLTTSFDISANASAGINHFTLVPVVGVPTVGINPDHSHQLKITLHGYKNTPSPIKNPEDANVAQAENRTKLQEQCRRDVGAACNDTQLLLEKIIQTQATSANKS